jgi:hypothetical protein
MKYFFTCSHCGGQGKAYFGYSLFRFAPLLVPRILVACEKDKRQINRKLGSGGLDALMETHNSFIYLQ